LDKDAEVLGLEVVEGTFREIKAELNLLPAVQVDDPIEGQMIADERVYRTSTLLPGRLVSLDRGADNQRQYVFARLFPVQYVPAQKRAILLTHCTLRLYSRPKGPPEAAAPRAGSRQMLNDRGEDLAAEAQCVVLCPAELRAAAEKLSRFHAEQEGITSAVVTTEAIGQTYAPAEDPLYEGTTRPNGPGLGMFRLRGCCSLAPLRPKGRGWSIFKTCFTLRTPFHHPMHRRSTAVSPRSRLCQPPMLAFPTNRAKLNPLSLGNGAMLKRYCPFWEAVVIPLLSQGTKQSKA
jgi:hypothetical protein